jgi:hypothetical protein
MLKTIEAEISKDGIVTLLEPVEIKKTSRALVTVMENGHDRKTGNVRAMLDLLNSPEFRHRRSYSSREIEEHIEEARNSWE